MKDTNLFNLLIWFPDKILRQKVIFFCTLYCITSALILKIRAQDFLPDPEIISDHNSLTNSITSSILQDLKGFIWIATSDGLCRFDGSSFKVFLSQETDITSLSSAPVKTLKLDSKGRIWIFSEESDLHIFDPGNESFINFLNLAFYKQHFGGAMIETMFIDSNDCLWLGLKLNGEQAITLVSIDVSTNAYTVLHGLDKPSYFADNELVRDIVQDKDGIIWVITDSGLEKYDESANAFSKVKFPDEISAIYMNNAPEKIFVSPGNELLIGFQSGLIVLESGRESFHYYPLSTQDSTELCFASDSRGDVFFANGPHLFRYRKISRPELVAEFDKSSGCCLSMLIDSSDVLWLGTAGMGVWKYDLNSSWLVSSLNPSQHSVDRFDPKVQITSVKINNKPVALKSVKTLKNRPSHSTSHIILDHDQNFITIRFAAMQYNRPVKNQYRYWLKGLERGWVYTSEPQAIYTALRPGNYTLIINASNTSGVWSKQINKLEITVNPPWWATWWAYSLYTLIVIGVCYGMVRIYFRQKEAEQLRMMDEVKSLFFANITHELRTPLTLILSLVDSLIPEFQQSPYSKRLVSISRNARHLLELINQLLDLSKLDAQAMSVEETRGQLSEFVGQLIEKFSQQAESGGLKITYHQSVRGQYWFDSGKLDTILSNLLANAIKFTPVGGQVHVELTASAFIKLHVMDTGKGIPQDQQNRIFDRFYRVADSSGNRRQTGTGIGLALVKELVQLQGGYITVESQAGRGSRFLVLLPYQPVEVAESAMTSQQPVNQEENIEKNLSEADAPAVLLVEDNDEMAEFIIECFPAHYRVLRSVNGMAGVEQAREMIPDLIISDVLMPEMSGFKLCQTLKADILTSHIPVILLTAKATHESRMEGLSAGADDYITKPFHVEELRLRVANLLEQRQRLREWVYKSIVPAGRDEEPAVTEDPFLTRLHALLEAKLDVDTYGVEELANEMGMSRVTLYRKVKAVTSLTANDVIRNYRLKRAAHFLKTGLNSTETSYRVGFDTPSYFAKCFRDLYHMSPSEYAQKYQEQ
ncbi:ATP-binding protein [Dyadobacter sp. NIV53]|uniref:hybrid sensor histidine kinase/response regulator n=1 Tax=Dyadobacter sp. NIV53 TaxID=2861765 RepID=UPI001C870840|nr:ATP-binding protein [Dyadobacter sp. NIV53]